MMTDDEISGCIAYANGIDPRVQMTVPNAQLWARVIGHRTAAEVRAGIQVYYERGRINGREHPPIDPASIRRIINEAYERQDAQARALEPPRNRVRSPESFRQRNPELWDKHFEAGRAEYQAENEKEKD